MKIRVISFTNKGFRLASELKEAASEYETEILYKGRDLPEGAFAPQTDLSEICRESFRRSMPLVFIGAAGIAVRSVAPYVRDKLLDPPVIVIDELGRFVIPILSGHAGGANEMARKIASAIGAEPVITTATDINDTFAADVFAVENGLRIMDRSGIAPVAASALAGKVITLSVKDYPPEEPVDILITDEVMPGLAALTLSPPLYAVGIGCRRGKSYEELSEFASAVFAFNDLDIRDAGCIATIDIKKDEQGLRDLAQAWRVPLIIYEASVLSRAEGSFTSSQAVYDRVGVDNVCERAAVIAAGPGSRLIVEKTAHNGMTIAIAERRI